jgi:SAM-dependent methyltransferase
MTKPDPFLESLKEGAWREVASINQALAEDRIDEEGWHAAMASLVKPAYLAGDNPYAQAGHSGNAATWEASRGFIAEALPRSGTFLDVGCASGVLMESVQRWGARKDLSIEPYGLDIVPEFVHLARRRLPHWADRIHIGNIRSWEPANQRFDFALIRPEYAPATRRVELIRHVLQRVLNAGGRLIILVGNEEAALRHMESSITSQGVRVHGRVEVPHPGDERLQRRLFWIDVSGG